MKDTHLWISGWINFSSHSGWHLRDKYIKILFVFSAAQDAFHLKFCFKLFDRCASRVSFRSKILGPINQPLWPTTLVEIVKFGMNCKFGQNCVHLHDGHHVGLPVGHHVPLHVGHHLSHHVGHHNVAYSIPYKFCRFGMTPFVHCCYERKKLESKIHVKVIWTG